MKRFYDDEYGCDRWAAFGFLTAVTVSMAAVIAALVVIVLWVT